MATTLSVVTFATSGPHKLQILQPAHNKNNNNNNNNNDNEIQRMDVKRKPPAIMVSPDSTATTVLIANGPFSHPGMTVTTPNNTSRMTTPTTNGSSALKARRRTSPPSGSASSGGYPPGQQQQQQQPLSVARRNARERNRVKQVNNGFATLRQHIPFTSRNKKMSKVETLRCAVEYIKSLQRLLDDNDTNVTSSAGEDNASTILPPGAIIFEDPEDASDSGNNDDISLGVNDYKDDTSPYEDTLVIPSQRSLLSAVHHQNRLPPLVSAFAPHQELTLVATSNSLSPTYSDTSSNNSSCPPDAPQQQPSLGGYLAVFGSSKSGTIDLQPLRHQSVKNEVREDQMEEQGDVLDVMTWWDQRSNLRQVTTS